MGVLLLLLLGSFVIYRTASETYGRQLDQITFLSESQPLLEFASLEHWQSTGQLSIFQGTEILRFFHQQLPINPYIFTQYRQMNIDPNAWYLVTTQRDMFNHLRDIIPEVKIYRDHRDLVYQGVELPYAHILVTPISPSVLLDLPIPEWKPSVDPSVSQYLLIRTKPEWDTLNNQTTLPDGLELIISGDFPLLELDQQRIRKFEEIYVLGKNASQLTPNSYVDQPMVGLARQIDVPAMGRIPVIPRSWWFILLTVTIGLSYFWFDRFWKATFWLLALVGGYFAGIQSYDLFLAWVAGGFFFGTDSHRQPIGFCFAMFWLYGASYRGMLLEPVAPPSIYLISGLILSFLFWSFPLESYVTKKIRGIDLLVIFGLLAESAWMGVLSSSVELTEQAMLTSNNLFLWGILFVTAVPLFINRPTDRTANNWIWLPAMVFWSCWVVYYSSPLVLTAFVFFYIARVGYHLRS